MANVTVNWRGDDFAKDVRGAVGNILAILALEFQTDIRKQLNKHASNISNGGKSSPPGTPPGRDTGALSRSWTSPKSVTTINDDDTAPRVRISSNLPYAGIHETGGVIKAKTSKWLTIPVTKEAKRRHVRSFPDLQYIPRKGKSPILAQMVGKGKNAKLKVFYVLKKSVKLPPRPYIRPALNETRSKAADIAEREMLAVKAKYK